MTLRESASGFWFLHCPSPLRSRGRRLDGPYIIVLAAFCPSRYVVTEWINSPSLMVPVFPIRSLGLRWGATTTMATYIIFHLFFVFMVRFVLCSVVCMRFMSWWVFCVCFGRCCLTATKAPSSFSSRNAPLREHVPCGGHFGLGIGPGTCSL